MRGLRRQPKTRRLDPSARAIRRRWLFGRHPGATGVPTAAGGCERRQGGRRGRLQGRPAHRSLSDFAKIVEVFDKSAVSFVSVTQQFNTTSSMGRLTLNILLSFAQFEREVTGERIRDKIAASKKRGIWVGGVVPLGYHAKDRKITVVEEEAKVVRHIFQLYLELGAVHPLLGDLRQRNV